MLVDDILTPGSVLTRSILAPARQVTSSADMTSPSTATFMPAITGEPINALHSAAESLPRCAVAGGRRGVRQGSAAPH